MEKWNSDNKTLKNFYIKIAGKNCYVLHTNKPCVSLKFVQVEEQPTLLSKIYIAKTV